MTSRQDFREIEIARLRLRPPVPDDLDAVHRLRTGPEVRKYLWDGEIISREGAASVLAGDVECFERHGFGIRAVLCTENQEMIGFCGLRFPDDTPDIELLYGFAPHDPVRL